VGRLEVLIPSLLDWASPITVVVSGVRVAVGPRQSRENPDGAADEGAARREGGTWGWRFLGGAASRVASAIGGSVTPRLQAILGALASRLVLRLEDTNVTAFSMPASGSVPAVTVCAGEVALDVVTEEERVAESADFHERAIAWISARRLSVKGLAAFAERYESREVGRAKPTTREGQVSSGAGPCPVGNGDASGLGVPVESRIGVDDVSDAGSVVSAASSMPEEDDSNQHDKVDVVPECLTCLPFLDGATHRLRKERWSPGQSEGGVDLQACLRRRTELTGSSMALQASLESAIVCCSASALDIMGVVLSAFRPAGSSSSQAPQVTASATERSTMSATSQTPQELSQSTRSTGSSSLVHSTADAWSKRAAFAAGVPARVVELTDAWGNLVMSERERSLLPWQAAVSEGAHEHLLAIARGLPSEEDALERFLESAETAGVPESVAAGDAGPTPSPAQAEPHATSVEITFAKVVVLALDGALGSCVANKAVMFDAVDATVRASRDADGSAFVSLRVGMVGAEALEVVTKDPKGFGETGVADMQTLLATSGAPAMTVLRQRAIAPERAFLFFDPAGRADSSNGVHRLQSFPVLSILGTAVGTADDSRGAPPSVSCTLAAGQNTAAVNLGAGKAFVWLSATGISIVHDTVSVLSSILPTTSDSAAQDSSPTSQPATTWQVEAAMTSISTVMSSPEAPTNIGLHLDLWQPVPATDRHSDAEDGVLPFFTLCAGAGVRNDVNAGVARALVVLIGNRSGVSRTGVVLFDTAVTSSASEDDSIFPCSMSVRQQSTTSGEDSGRGAFDVDTALMEAWEALGRAKAQEAGDEVGCGIPMEHRSNVTGTPTRASSDPECPRKQSPVQEEEEWLLHHMTVEKARLFVDIALPRVFLHVNHQAVLDIGALLKDITDPVPKPRNETVSTQGEHPVQEDIRTTKMRKKADAGMVVLSLSIAEVVAEVTSQQSLSIPAQLSHHRYQLPQRRHNSSFRLLAGQVAVTSVSALAGHPLCSGLGVSAAAVCVQELASETPTFPLACLGRTELIPSGFGHEEWPGAFDGSPSLHQPGLEVWSILTARQGGVDEGQSLSPTGPSCSPGKRTAKGVDLALSMHLGRVLEERTHPIWEGDDDSEYDPVSGTAARMGASMVLTSRRGDASAMTSSLAMAGSGLWGAVAGRRVQGNQMSASMLLRRGVSAERDLSAGWQDLGDAGKAIPFGIDSQWMLKSAVAVKLGNSTLTTDVGRFSFDYVDVLMDTLKIPLPIAPSVRPDDKTLLVRALPLNIRLRPAQGCVAGAAVSVKDAAYTSVSTDTHHIVARGIQAHLVELSASEGMRVVSPSRVVASDECIVVTICSRGEHATTRTVHLSQPSWQQPVWEVLVSNAHLAIAATPEDLSLLAKLVSEIKEAPSRRGYEDKTTEEAAANLIGDMLLDPDSDLRSDCGNRFRASCLSDLVQEKVLAAMAGTVERGQQTASSVVLGAYPGTAPAHAGNLQATRMTLREGNRKDSPRKGLADTDEHDGDGWEVLGRGAEDRQAARSLSGQDKERRDEHYMEDAARAALMMRVRADTDLLEMGARVKGQICVHDVSLSISVVGDRAADEGEVDEDGVILLEGGEIELSISDFSVTHALYVEGTGVVSRTVVTVGDLLLLDQNVAPTSDWHRIVGTLSTADRPRRDGDPFLKLLVTSVGPGAAERELSCQVRLHPLRVMVDQHVVMFCQRLVGSLTGGRAAAVDPDGIIEANASGSDSSNGASRGDHLEADTAGDDGPASPCASPNGSQMSGAVSSLFKRAWEGGDGVREMSDLGSRDEVPPGLEEALVSGSGSGEIGWDDGDIREMLQDASTALSQAEPHRTGIFVQRLVIAGSAVCVDYRPRKVDVRSLGRGKWAELINAIPVTECSLELKACELTGVYTGQVGAEVGARWARDIALHQSHRILQGLPALRSVGRIGNAARQAVERPLKTLFGPGEDGSLAAGDGGKVNEWDLLGDVEEEGLVNHIGSVLSATSPEPKHRAELLDDWMGEVESEDEEKGSAARRDQGWLGRRLGKASREMARGLKHLGKSVASEVLSVGVGLSEGAEFLLSAGHPQTQSGGIGPANAREGVRTALRDLKGNLAARRDAIAAGVRVRPGEGALVAATQVAGSTAAQLAGGARDTVSAARTAMRGLRRGLEPRRRPRGWKRRASVDK